MPCRHAPEKIDNVLKLKKRFEERSKDLGQAGAEAELNAQLKGVRCASACPEYDVRFETSTCCWPDSARPAPQVCNGPTAHAPELWRLCSRGVAQAYGADLGTQYAVSSSALLTEDAAAVRACSCQCSIGRSGGRAGGRAGAAIARLQVAKRQADMEQFKNIQLLDEPRCSLMSA